MEDEKTGMRIDSGVDFNKIRRGWHNIIICLDNQYEMKVTFFLDGKQTKESQTVNCCSPFGYIGNSKDGSQPFGTFSDLRIYPYILKQNQIIGMSKYHDELEFEMPDKYHIKYMNEGITDIFIQRLKSDTEGT